MTCKPEFSIVIPTHNRAALLHRVLDALYAQTVPSDCMEIIIVDSMSSDATPELLRQRAAQHPNLQFVRMERPGAAAARNSGLDLAIGTLIVLLDDDILVPPDFLEKLRGAVFKYPSSVILSQIGSDWQNATDPFLRYLEQAQDVNSYLFTDREKVPHSHFYTACVALPSVLLKGLRFDEKFSGYGLEDTDFGIRLLADEKNRMVYLPELKVRHEYHPQYEDYRRKKYSVGKILRYFLSKSPEHAATFYIEPTALRRWYRIYIWICAPLAKKLWKIESRRQRGGPIPKLLYTWIQRDLRVQIYNGMRDAKTDALAMCSASR